MADDGKEVRGAMRWAMGVVATLVVLYLVIFLVAVLDELVFETYWLEEYMPEAVYTALGWLMEPMGWLLEQVGWV